MAFKTHTRNGVSVEDPVALGLDLAADPTIVHQITQDVPDALDATTTPPATTVWSDNVALVTGAKTLDLQALVNDNLPNIDLTGLKVQVLQVQNPEGNANVITMTSGAVNGYDIGGASFSVALNPGDIFTMYLKDNAPDVAAADSELDFAGTGSQTFDILIVAG